MDKRTLKIKNGVNLKELEKFGFELDGNTYKYFIAKINAYIYVFTIEK